jgi:hypothetical protein
MKKKYAKPKGAVPKALQRKAQELNKPLHLKPMKFEKYQASALLRAQHLQEQDMKHRKAQHEQLTRAIHTVQPSLRGDLIQQRSKLLK